MVKRPKTLAADALVGDVRRLFENEHVRTALLVDGERFAGALDREDVPPDAGDAESAQGFGRFDTVPPELSAGAAVDAMLAAGTRRLVVARDGVLLGLLCLTSDLETFCSSG
jgi:CBS domain-containing protein